MIDVNTLANTLVALAEERSSQAEAVDTFFSFLTAHNLGYLAPKIYAVLQARAQRRQDDEHMHIATAHPVSQELLEVLQEKVKQVMDRPPENLDHEVQPSLLGGFRVRANNVLVDASVRQNIKRLRQHLRG